MNLPFTRRGAIALVVSAATLVTLQGMSSPMAGAAPRSSAAPTSTVGSIEDATARALATSLDDQRWRAQVRSAALASDEVDLSALTAKATAPGGKALAARISKADERVAEAKGLSADTGSLLRLRLGSDAMRDKLTAEATPLVAAANTDDDATTITAYDSKGKAHELDAREVPNQPVYVVDVDVAKAMAAGLDIIDKTLTKSGLSTPQVTEKLADSGFWSTKMDAVRLSNDEEPWTLGDAEIFSIVSGFGLDGKVRVDTVTMPYLDTDGTTYYPNQILVNWSYYKYNLADVVMMEDDGDTNYQALAKAIADILLTITDQGMYIPLVNAILDAIPTSWWTNDPDYVDSWYTLSKDSSGRLNGARANGWMNVSPYWVGAL